MARIHIADETGKFSAAQCKELENFICDELLSNEQDWTWLNRVVIRNCGATESRGYWEIEGLTQTKGIVTALGTEIVLNFFHLKTLSQLKKTLAHEYGHHWTLCYLIVNYNFNVSTEPVPEPYYQFRGLDPAEYCYISYQDRAEWEKCDREVLAEDYRICFAPPDYALQHAMVPPLGLPNDDVREWILGLCQPPRSQAGSTSPKNNIPPDLSEFPDQGSANPFQPLYGRIERPEYFYGRQQELKQIFELLNAGSGVELLGERQVGKSSVLWRVKHLVENERLLARQALYLNLQEVQSDSEFYQAFCAKLGISTCSGYRFFQTLQSYRLILLLDEAEQMTQQGFTRNLRDQLRSLAEGENAPLRLVIAARTPLATLFPNSAEHKSTSPFHEICSRVELLPWSQSTVQAFITARLQQTDVQFTESEIETLWQHSLGHPQRLMKACFDQFNRYDP